VGAPGAPVSAGGKVRRGLQEPRAGGDGTRARPPLPVSWKAPGGRRVRPSALLSRERSGLPGENLARDCGAPRARSGTLGSWAGQGAAPPVLGSLGSAGGTEKGRFLRVRKEMWAAAAPCAADPVQGIRSPSRSPRGRNAARSGGVGGGEKEGGRPRNLRRVTF
jgi:hypothetical protein